MNIGPDGDVIWTDIIENTGNSRGEGIITTEDGFLITGVSNAMDMDFEDGTSYGDYDMFTALYTTEGNRLNLNTVGGNGIDLAAGLVQGWNGIYLEKLNQQMGCSQILKVQQMHLS